MKSSVPDYYLSLVMQYSSVSNASEADRTNKAIVGSILAVSDSTNRVKINNLLPIYLREKSRKEFKLKRKTFKTAPQSVYFARVKTQLSLSDNSEVIHKTNSVLKSMSIVMNDNTYAQLLEYFPPHLREIANK